MQIAAILDTSEGQTPAKSRQDIPGAGHLVRAGPSFLLTSVTDCFVRLFKSALQRWRMPF
jgi:hypothetical protein